VIEETARVVNVEPGYAWVETMRQSSCGSCSARGGCGTSVLGKVLGQRSVRVRAVDKVGAAVGEEVVVGLDDAALLRGSLAVYMLPLIALIAGALIAETIAPQWGLGEGFVMFAGIAGLALGFLWLRLFSRRVVTDLRYQAVILRRTPAPSVPVAVVNFNKQQ
jgi:sigma-E factor negative regulatory protein RseC